jgi:hypothetical protein
LAPDSEASDAVDDKLDNLIAEANKREVPVLYGLTRRKLAKAIHVNMRQVVVGVFDPQGAFDIYKKLVAYVERWHREQAMAGSMALLTGCVSTSGAAAGEDAAVDSI